MAKRWYSVSVLSNFEKKVRDAILEAVEQEELGEEITDVLVPTEEVVEVNVEANNLETEYSMRNKRSELTDVLDTLNVEYKKSFSKSKLLELINNNR